MSLGTILLMVFSTLILLVIVGTYIKTRNASRQRKRDLDEEYQRQREALINEHNQDPLKLGVECCRDPSTHRQMYYRLFKDVAENHVRRHGTYITNNELTKLEYEFRENYNRLMGTDFKTAPGHYTKLKALLKHHKLMQ